MLAKAASYLRQAKSSMHPVLVGVNDSIGEHYLCYERDYTRAEEYLVKSLTIGQKVLPANHPQLATIYKDLGRLYLKKGDNTKAEKYYLKCLNIRQEVLPDDIKGLLGSLDSLNDLYKVKGDFAKVKKYSDRISRVRKEHASAGYPNCSLQ
jgi:tetratricopeptide (TPR) repeat protein